MGHRFPLAVPQRMESEVPVGKGALQTPGGKSSLGLGAQAADDTSNWEKGDPKPVKRGPGEDREPPTTGQPRLAHQGLLLQPEHLRWLKFQDQYISQVGFPHPGSTTVK